MEPRAQTKHEFATSEMRALLEHLQVLEPSIETHGPKCNSKDVDF